MTIFSGSRYRGVEKVQVNIGTGETNAVYVIRRTTSSPLTPLRSYRVKAGETFESLAENLFGEGGKWYVLADLNPHIFWPLALRPGDSIVIPTKAYVALV